MDILAKEFCSVLYVTDVTVLVVIHLVLCVILQQAVERENVIPVWVKPRGTFRGKTKVAVRWNESRKMYSLFSGVVWIPFTLVFGCSVQEQFTHFLLSLLVAVLLGSLPHLAVSPLLLPIYLLFLLLVCSEGDLWCVRSPSGGWTLVQAWSPALQSHSFLRTARQSCGGSSPPGVSLKLRS